MSGNPLPQIVRSIPPHPPTVAPSRGGGTSTANDDSTPSVAAPRPVRATRLADAGDEIVRSLQELIDSCIQDAQAGASLAQLERTVASQFVPIVQRVVALAFAAGCRAAMEADVRMRGLSPAQVRLRTDADGYVTLSTTFGPVTFPTFAYREVVTPKSTVMRRPADGLLPYHGSCRSSPLCLEWEARVGAETSFRDAEEALRFFTRGASTVEDTTISRHMLALSEIVEPEWLYRKPEDIRQTLVERATRDKVDQRPLIYVSSDAHALRRYVDDGWERQWKMVNGIRAWCEDRDSGAVIHLGGEFTWGDCHEVGRRIRELAVQGILPNDDPAWAAVNAQIVFISDGSEWLVEHVVPELHAPVVILDPYHLIDWFTQFTKIVFGAGSPRSRAFHADLRRILFNKRSKVADESHPRTRRGHKKRRGSRRPHAHQRRWNHRGRPRTVSSDFTARGLLDLLAGLKFEKSEHVEALESLIERVTKNTLRIDYVAHLARGLQIGSGAMESLHRNGSQLRLKRPGSTWMEETSQAVLSFRMLKLSGRWREFWDRPNIVPTIAQAFAARRAADATAEAA